MAIADIKTAANEFIPNKDVLDETPDGRQIVIARAGVPMPLEAAKKHGLVKAEKAEQPEKENKAVSAAPENKSDTENEKPKGGKK